MRKLFRRPAAVPAAFVLGLVIATAATAGAASLITGKQIKDGSITAKDLSQAVRKQLAKTGAAGTGGPAGAVGAVGPAGSAGDAGPTGPAGPTGLKGDKGDKGDPGADGSPDTAAQVLTKVKTVDGSGSGLDADTIDGVDAASLAKYSAATQVNQTNAMAVGANEYWFSFGYTAGQLVSWQVVPTTVGGKLKLDVESEAGASNTVTYWLRVTNTGSVATGYQLKRHHLTP